MLYKIRWYYAAFAFAGITAAIVTVLTVVEHRKLAGFCEKVEPGQGMAQVRKSASDQGFTAKMEPYARLRVEPTTWQWHYSPPACRVFFNERHRTVEYRLWQG